MQRIRYHLQVLDPAGATVSRSQLDVGHYRIGRGAECEIRSDVRGVSREHLRLQVAETGGCLLQDLGSTNGSQVDGKPIRMLALRGDFVLQLGELRLRFREQADLPEGLAFATGMPAEPAPSATGASQTPGTRVVDLTQRLADALWQALPQAKAGLADAAPRIAAAWLDVLEARGLRIQDVSGAVLGAAGDPAAGTTCVARQGGLQILVDEEAASRYPALAAVLATLLPWWPQPADAITETAREEAVPAPGVATTHAGLRRQQEALRRVARARVGILLLGETGAGKEVLARWVHACSPRRDGPFVAINCAALPRDLLEVELFGIERGTATGVDARPGLFEQAHGGTLFLDELGDMPMETQVRLLRAMEDGRIHRVGGQRLIETDVRLLAATHQDLEQAMSEGRFRRDLYHRVAGFEIRLPPLRERPGDIAPLAFHFFTRALADNGQSSPGISAAALACLQAWHWPGNVRELRQAVESACAMLGPGDVLDHLHLPPRIADLRPIPADLAGPPQSLAQAVAAAERVALEAAMQRSDGDPETAWTLLDIGKTTFYKKLKEHGLATARPSPP